MNVERLYLFPGALLAIGTLAFSGSLYVHVLAGVGWAALAAPFGGATLIAGWACLAWAALASPPRAH